jgi:hypothetical protein
VTNADLAANADKAAEPGETPGHAINRLDGMRNIERRVLYGGFANFHLAPQLRLTTSALYGAGNGRNGLRVHLALQHLQQDIAPHHTLALSAGVTLVNRAANMLLALCLGAGACAAQGQVQGQGQAQAGWVSYRDAYRSMVTFAKYGKAKNFLQNHYQVAAKDGSLPPDGLRFTLSGRTTQLNLPLDATGRTTLPLLKAAYDENAMLVLNRKTADYTFKPRISIVARVNGVYESADLRAACEQALHYMQATEAGHGNRHCAGVRFAFLPKSDAAVRIREPLRESALPAGEGAAFDGDANTQLRVMTYRFAEWPERVQVISQNAPVAIVPVIE